MADFLEKNMSDFNEKDPTQKATEQILYKDKQKTKKIPEIPELESPMMEIIT